MTLQERLAEAEAAYHEIALGRQVVRVSIEGQETEFNRASLPALRAYIASLKDQIGFGGGYGAIGIVF